MTNKTKTLTMTICLLGIVFALTYSPVVYGEETVTAQLEKLVPVQEASTATSVSPEQQLAGLKTQLAFEQLIMENLDLKFKLIQPQLAQFEQLKARLAQLEQLRVDIETNKTSNKPLKMLSL